jgi:AcrR family transcriptional regulator
MARQGRQGERGRQGRGDAVRAEYAGAGDVARSMELLWGMAPSPARGPKPGLSVEAITATAVSLADESGLEALSMRRLAERLGVGTMSLYRYIPGRAELLDLMVDRVSGEYRAESRGGDGRAGRPGLRSRLEHVARENLRLYMAHPWLARVFPGRPPMGPGVLGKYETELAALEGCGLSDAEMDLVLGLVEGYVRGAAAAWLESSLLEERTGLTDQAWWRALAPTLERFFQPEAYPLATRVGEAAAGHHGGSWNPEVAFEFGLARILDGIGAFVAR